jgi:Ca2+/Na+ antiporter
MTERIWIMVSGILLVLAAAFVWRNNYSVAFGIATLGACAWFLSYRAQLKTRITDDDENDERDDEQPNED